MAKAKKPAVKQKKATPAANKKTTGPKSNPVNTPVLDDDMPTEPPEPGHVWRKSIAGWVQTVEVVNG